MENQEEGKQGQDDRTEEEGMEIERRKLPKHYANQVRSQCVTLCVKDLESFLIYLVTVAVRGRWFPNWHHDDKVLFLLS